MRASLGQEQTLNELASFLYDFLPGKAHPYADQRISFGGVAATLGLGQFWSAGSKKPAILGLLKFTLEQKQQSFCPLIVEVVRRGIAYRDNKGSPITREEITTLNGLVKELGFKIPELYDPKFLDRLPRTEPERAITLSEKTRKKLAEQLVQLGSVDPQPRGYAFEAFLGDLFEAFELAPRDAFRLVGEQIDGSLQFQTETYLLEATWRNKQVGQEELLAFSGKVSGKARWSRGLFISYAGFTADGLEAFVRGKPTTIICMDGLDLYDILNNKLDLRAVLELKARKAAETNEAFIPARNLFPAIP
jgi:hypothetical protein